MAVTDLQFRPATRGQTRRKPVAVVDIGSNSVRLVIYDGPWRSPAALHNEKAICAIGRNMVTTGRLDSDGMYLALETLARFRDLCRGHEVHDVAAVATAAARDASNGREFIRSAEKALGHPIQILAGEEEARIAAEGTLAGIPGADGLVADLGGGSLDMVTVEAGETGAGATLPFGPLRLMDSSGGNLSKARDTVEKKLSAFEVAKWLKGRSLYAVGGIWRALAHVDMEEQDYPLSVLHQYVIPAGRAIKLCRVVSGLSRKSLEKMRSVPKRRAEALPYGALVMEEMLRSFSLKQVVISAYGVREGVLQSRLPPEERRKDPLLEYARDANRRVARNEAHAEELAAWTQPLFPDETPAQRRIRQAVCLFSDIAWRRHPDDRAIGALRQVLLGAYAGADHAERSLMAAALWFRYAGNRALPDESGIGSVLGDEAASVARQLGLTARLAFGITGSIGGVLPACRLQVGKDSLLLEMPIARKALAAEPVHKRLASAADAFAKHPQIVLI